ncbi:hypothetical protein NLU66_05585 [Brachybacterium sp. NBEC-018]|uniref:hypothetical protein n=1 Tax=Brachybacterium sp. NBEC-018 TaxID=2996004 RepID=UPI002175025E|nr:hypothetical protein [Brachybacterium sp. NBEC-018]UVY85071.1 hypothetical protein NLU66_05585 [Brachybacterium sp. NBEC-018]
MTRVDALVHERAIELVDELTDAVDVFASDLIGLYEREARLLSGIRKREALIAELRQSLLEQAGDPEGVKALQTRVANLEALIEQTRTVYEGRGNHIDKLKQLLKEAKRDRSRLASQTARLEKQNAELTERLERLLGTKVMKAQRVYWDLRRRGRSSGTRDGEGS